MTTKAAVTAIITMGQSEDGRRAGDIRIQFDGPSAVPADLRFELRALGLGTVPGDSAWRMPFGYIARDETLIRTKYTDLAGKCEHETLGHALLHGFERIALVLAKHGIDYTMADA